MSRYRPGLDDDRLVGEALEALAHDTDGIEAPPEVEARLRAAFRAPMGSAVVPEAPTRSSAWKWVATVGVAAGLMWVAYAATHREPNPSPSREMAGTAPGSAAIAPRETAPPAPTIVPAPPRTRRVASTDATRAVGVVSSAPSRPIRRPARAEPRVERFEPLYPGDPLADLDAVHLVRVSVPRSALATLGWPSRPGARDDRVELDAMVGPDGMTRAVRFISQ